MHAGLSGGCYNPGTHDPAGGYEADSEALAAGLLDLVRRVREGGPLPHGRGSVEVGVSVVVFTGYCLEEVGRLPLGEAVLAHTDVLIAERSDRAQHLGRGLLGSVNQRIHLLTDRYRHDNFEGVPVRDIVVHRDGTVTISGIGAT